MRKGQFVISVLLISITLFLGCSKKNPVASDKAITLTDIDGNVYETVQIGNQVWMAENLKATHFRDGTPITKMEDNTTWTALYAEPYYSAYDNNESNADIYGYLYNWFAVGDSRNIAPEGWRVPLYEDWMELINYLGENFIGGKLKEADTLHWKSPNYGATNESGFTALPGGIRDKYSGLFSGLGEEACFWSATESSQHVAWYIGLTHRNSGYGSGGDDKRFGFSVRLVKGRKNPAF